MSIKRWHLLSVKTYTWFGLLPYPGKSASFGADHPKPIALMARHNGMSIVALAPKLSQRLLT